MSVTKMLKGHELFQSLSFEEVDDISRFSGIKELNDDEFVFTAGAPATHLYIVLEGKLQLRLAAKAHEASLVVGIFEKGHHLAVLSGDGISVSITRPVTIDCMLHTSRYISSPGRATAIEITVFSET